MFFNGYDLKHFNQANMDEVFVWGRIQDINMQLATASATVYEKFSFLLQPTLEIN